MGFKRILFPKTYAKKDALTSDLVSIGFQLQWRPGAPANIEDTLIAASIEGVAGDYRILAILVDWLDQHLFNVNADRLTKLVIQQNNLRLKAFWCAIAEWKKDDNRFKKISKLTRRRIDLLEFGTDFIVDKKGEDPRFENTVLRVPNETLRKRERDVLSPPLVAKIHPAYRARLMIGPTYRADMWAILESNHGEVSLSDLARQAYGCFNTAIKAKKDWSILKGVLAS
jgi:hypothetical protein